MKKILPKEYIACHAEGMTAKEAYVYVFVGKENGLEAVRTYTGGTHYLIGYTPAAFQAARINASNWKDAFSDRACGGSRSDGLVDNALIWGTGPADYDSSSGMDLSCKGGKLNVTFLDLDASSKESPRKKDLICELVK
jgi:hypothetical protein